MCPGWAVPPEPACPVAAAGPAGVSVMLSSREGLTQRRVWNVCPGPIPVDADAASAWAQVVVMDG